MALSWDVPRGYFRSLVLTEKKHAMSLDHLFQLRGSVKLCMALASTLAMAGALYKLPSPLCPTDTRVTGGTGTGIREVSCQALCLELLADGDVQGMGTVRSAEW